MIKTRFFLQLLTFLYLITSDSHFLHAEEKSIHCEAQYTAASGSYSFVDAQDDTYDIPENATIGKIHYRILEIFDETNPKENNLIYRFANRFHIETKEELIKTQLLFDEGEIYKPRLLKETARLLRRQGYLFDANIQPVSECDGKVDVEVITRDVWSFTPEASFSRSGGENTYRFKLRETNAFGTGQEISIGTSKDLDRKSNSFAYKNNNIRGSRISGRAQFSNNDDGSQQFFSVQLPFYALDSRRAWGVRFNQFKQTDPQFFRGDNVTEVDRDGKDYILTYGFSKGLIDGVTRRWTLGYRFREDKFQPSEGNLPPPAEFPVDRTSSYPFLEYSSVVDDYATASNLDQFQRIEDVHLGHTLIARIGFAAEAFGSDENRIVMEGQFDDTIFYDQNILWRHRVGWRGLWNTNSNKAEDVVFNYRMRYFRNQTAHRSFYARFDAVYTKNLNTNQQVAFGGTTGARAFVNRLQVGDRRVSFSIEERLYSDIHLFNLLRLGGALFIDVGRAWEPGVDQGFEDDFLANIGIGLRLASTKADDGRVIHVDIAFPLTNRNDPDVNSNEISVSFKNSF